MDTLDALTNTLTKSFKCWECKKELKSENGRLYHFVQQHARAILSIDADPSSSLQKQIQKAEDLLKTTTSNSTTVSDKSMLSTNARLLTKPVNETEAKQDHIKSTDLKNNRIGKTIFCLQCNKKFRSTGKFKKHIDAKHSRINCDTTTSNIRILPDRTLRLNEQLQSENDININAQNSSSCSQYLEQIEPTNNSVHQFTDNHVELATSLHSLPSIPFININSASSYQIKNTEQMNYSASLSCRSSNCVEIFESTSNYDNNLKTKGIEINSSISTKTIDHVNMMKQSNDCIRTFPCWQCDRKFQSVSERLDHCLRKHAIYFRSKILNLLAYANNRVEVPQFLADSTKVSISSTKRSFRSCQCMKK
ncbi:unnamed protein product [Rotaria sp. Silwood2]|nr:unnamed protein product [Rotaria sp. Silwood2]CAF4511421.1 unnamed protein product [Rotaria sp. Silwood2]